MVKRSEVFRRLDLQQMPVDKMVRVMAQWRRGEVGLV
jgi:hypothetical protein